MPLRKLEKGLYSNSRNAAEGVPYRSSGARSCTPWLARIAVRKRGSTVSRPFMDLRNSSKPDECTIKSSSSGNRTYTLSKRIVVTRYGLPAHVGRQRTRAFKCLRLRIGLSRRRSRVESRRPRHSFQSLAVILSTRRSVSCAQLKLRRSWENASLLWESKRIDVWRWIQNLGESSGWLYGDTIRSKYSQHTTHQRVADCLHLDYPLRRR